MSGSGSANASEEDCTKLFSSTPYIAVAAIRAVVGTFSAVCCLGVILIIVLYQKYRVFTQRLVLNLAIAALVHSLSYPLARVNYYSDLQLLDPYCLFGGFFNQYSAWIELLALMCIVYHLFVGGILGRATHKLEPLFWVGTYSLPLLWCWIPFIQQAYGTSGGLCAIRTLNEDCTAFTFGQVLQFVLWYVPLYALLIITCIVSVAVAIKVRRDVHRWSGVYDAETKAKTERVRTEIRPLLWFPFIYLALNTFSFIDRVTNIAKPDDPVLALTYLHVLTSPFRGAFVALVYTVIDPSTLRMLRWTQVRASCQRCYRREEKWSVQEYPAMAANLGESLNYNIAGNN